MPRRVSTKAQQRALLNLWQRYQHPGGTMTRDEKIRNDALEEAAKMAESFFVGIFTGWKGHTGESTITLDEAEDAASECGPICAKAIRGLKTRVGNK